MRKTWFGFDEGALYPGFTKGERWNGWACPRFAKEVAVEYMEDYKRQGMSAHYDEATDAFYFQMEEGTPFGVVDYVDNDGFTTYVGWDSHKGFDIEVNGQVIHVYAIGAWSWIWDEYPRGTRKSEEEELEEFLETEAENVKRIWG